MVVLLFATGKPDQSGLTLFAIQPQDMAGSWNNNLGLINLAVRAGDHLPAHPRLLLLAPAQANWTYTGYDASAHVAEETVGARMASAWGVFLSVAVCAVVGFIFLVALTTHLPNLSTLFPATLDDAAPGRRQPVLLRRRRRGHRHPELQPRPDLGDILAAGIAIAMGSAACRRSPPPAGCCSRSAATTGSPGRGWLKKVSHRYRTPANALIAIVVVAWLFTVAAFVVGTGTAIVIVTAISTIFLYAAYGIVHLPRRDDERWREHRVWSLGRWSKPIAWVAVFWVVVLMVLFCFPTSGNISLAVHGRDRRPAARLLLRLGANALQGPARSMGAEAELTEIEREFEHAAEELGGPAPA